MISNTYKPNLFFKLLNQMGVGSLICDCSIGQHMLVVILPYTAMQVGGMLCIMYHLMPNCCAGQAWISAGRDQSMSSPVSTSDLYRM